jgi:N-formylmaleamate deformylase
MPTWRSGNVVANGIKIHYHRTGGEGPPLVLSHGITDHGLCWTRVAQALEGDCDVIMYDARGHGLSFAPERGYSVHHRAADLAGLIHVLGLGRSCLMGHSMGADTTALTAAAYPELARCAILEDPPWRETSDDSARMRATREAQWRRYIVELKSKTRDELLAYAREHRSTWDEAEFGPWMEAKLQVSPLAAQAAATVRPPWQETVCRIPCPILLITGDPERGAIVTPEVAEEAATLWQGGRVAHIPGTGHNIRREQFDRYIEVVREFLAEVIEGEEGQ